MTPIFRGFAGRRRDDVDPSAASRRVTVSRSAFDALDEELTVAP